MLVSELILAYILGVSLMVFKDYTSMHQPCSNIRSYVGVNYVTLDLLPGKEQSKCFILHCMATRRRFGCWTNFPERGETQRLRQCPETHWVLGPQTFICVKIVIKHWIVQDQFSDPDWISIQKRQELLTTKRLIFFPGLVTWIPSYLACQTKSGQSQSLRCVPLPWPKYPTVSGSSSTHPLPNKKALLALIDCTAHTWQF